MIKKNFKILSILTLVMILFSGFCFATDTSSDTSSEDPALISENPTSGEDTAEENISSVGEPNIVEENVYLTGEDVNLTDWVIGSVFIIGKNVTIESQIPGDVFVIADQVTFKESTYVEGNIFVLANKVQVDAILYDLYACANSVNISETGFIYRDLRVSANELTIQGKVRRDLEANVNKLNIVSDGSLIIYGDVTYTSKQEASIPEGSVAGEVNFTKESVDVLGYVLKVIATLVLVSLVLLVGFIIAPKGLEKLERVMKIRLLPAILVGLLAIIVIPIISIILMLTVIGVKAALVVLAVYGLLLVLAFSMTCIALGKLLANKFTKNSKLMQFLMVILSTAVLIGLGFIPYIGFVINLIITVIGVGLLVTTICFKNIEKKEEVTSPKDEKIEAKKEQKKEAKLKKETPKKEDKKEVKEEKVEPKKENKEDNKE